MINESNRQYMTDFTNSNININLNPNSTTLFKNNVEDDMDIFPNYTRPSVSDSNNFNRDFNINDFY